MKIRIAINGFGRIGRTFLRCIMSNKKLREFLNVVVINCGPSPIEDVAHMFKYDTLMGTFDKPVEMRGNHLIIDGHIIDVIAEREVTKLPWEKYTIDWVVDCTGAFTDGVNAQKHCDVGARKVLISAPAHNEDIAIVPGVNHEKYNPEQHTIVSLGSCTTNAFVTMLKIINDTCGIARGAMTTTHAYTNSQVLLDVEAKNLRFSRAAGLNIIPASTGASEMIEKIIPELSGKITAVALRVPVGKVSLIDFVFEAHKEISSALLNKAFEQAAHTAMAGIVNITYEPLVSSDFFGDNHSVIIDGSLTQTSSTMGHVFGWYDNEWGYSMRMADFLYYTARR